MLQPFTVSVMTALVLMVAGAVFVIETLLRKDEGAGRVWALAFLAGMLTTVAYLVWGVSPRTWWAVAVGNGSFVAGTGLLWLGSRRFNERPMMVPSLVVGAASLAASIAVVIDGPDGGDWAGAIVMFVGIAAFAVAGTVETVTGEMGRNRNAAGLALVLGLQAAYYIVRSFVFIAFGPESWLFERWFNTIVTSLLTVTLTIVAVVTTSVLRAGKAQLPGRPQTTVLGMARDGVLLSDAFQRVLADRTAHARRNGELMGVISTRLDDLAQLSTAFGSAEAQQVQRAWRASAVRFAPTSAFVGDDGEGGVAIGVHPTSQADARRMATRVSAGMSEALAALGTSVVPVLGVGVALTDTVGYDPGKLVDAARDASARASDSDDAGVIVAG
ncbi:hypothetical protein ACPW96_04270 [Micromonospora sp. DT81.3]|uniref:hypothetical protein n=1 Tax=Actinomycetes TaxID=1760 RepID=UPI003CF9528D